MKVHLIEVKCVVSIYLFCNIEKKCKPLNYLNFYSTHLFKVPELFDNHVFHALSFSCMLGNIRKRKIRKEEKCFLGKKEKKKT